MVRKDISNNIVLILLFGLFFTLCSFGISLGYIADWNILDHVAMVDRMRMDGSLYSGVNDFPSMASSNYFPGLSFLTITIGYLIPDGVIVEFLHLVSILALFLFAGALFKVSKELNDISFIKFLSIFIFLSILILPNWYGYALKLKPDTLAIGMGLGALYLLDKSSERIGFGHILLSILVALPIILKQQYIAIICGYLIFSIISKRTHFIFSAVIVVATSSSLLLYINSIENAWFWSVTMLAGHGLNDIGVWAKENFYLAIRVGFALLVVLLTLGPSAFRSLKAPIEFCVQDLKIFRKPWALPLIFASGASFVSGLKAGGNVGNTELAIIILLPFILTICGQIHSNVAIALATLTFLIAIPDSAKAIKIYMQIKDAEQHFYGVQTKPDDMVFTTSDHYGIVRSKRHVAALHNWHHEILVNKRPDNEVAEFVNDTGFSYVVLPKFLEINTTLQSHYNFALRYTNDHVVILEKSRLSLENPSDTPD